MSGAATRRINKEYAELQADWPPHVQAHPDESNLLHWVRSVAGVRVASCRSCTDSFYATDGSD